MQMQFKSIYPLICGAAAIGLPLLFALPVHAAVQVVNTTQNNQVFVVSNSDLAQTNIASIQTTGLFTNFGSAGAVVLNDGSFGRVGASGGDAALTGGGASITFNFLSPQNIGEIATYSGWDNARGGQSYTVSYATAGDPSNFLTLASVFNNPFGGDSTSTRAVITDSSGVLASNVASVRFAFNGDLIAGPAGYREIDIFAAQAQAPAIPEPASWAMLIAGFGLVGAVARRRQHPVVSLA